ncbi:MAG: DUF4349 domain-containing protein [Bacteroidota bacterium]
MKKVIFLIVIVLSIVSSCSQQKESMAAADALEDAAEKQHVTTDQSMASHTDLYSDGKAKLIKTAQYRFQVKSVKQSTEAIEAAIRKYPAYIAGSNLHLENPILESKITIRVQSEYFQDLLKDIDQQAIFVNFRNITTDDVSKDIVDLESRLKTKREVEARYAEILRKKAGTLEELMDAEQKIGELHEEIEATIGRINYVKDQVSYSTINLEFYQTIEENIASTPEESLGMKFKKAFSVGLDGLISFSIRLAYVWPLFFAGLLAVVFLKLRKKRLVKIKGI